MKKLLLLSLFIFPALASFAQRFEISEQAGASFTKSSFQKNGFTNQLAVGYHLHKHIELSAFYEMNKWKSINNSFGLSLDYTARYFFVGVDGKYAWLNPYTENSWAENVRYTYNPTLGYGIHAGAKQKLFERLSLIEQIGYVWAPFKFATEGISGPSILSSIFNPSSTEGRLPKAEVDYFYARIGLSYRL